ncbi:hypothetical protein JG688_00009331 [Phytophthora aleatoria]|uniref:Uncharacterized protein n=1 Tax=Phytophthora aleatoria TaxID=2496075 RepID=A0A8J5M2G7_9STRA|nr:hypothetical protein JG688_00009331 [Phytophthora aleatoria]
MDKRANRNRNHNPIQKDGVNCCLFACLFFWRKLFKEATNDFTETGLVRRRWDILRVVIDFGDATKSEEENVDQATSAKHCYYMFCCL